MSYVDVIRTQIGGRSPVDKSGHSKVVTQRNDTMAPENSPLPEAVGILFLGRTSRDYKGVRHNLGPTMHKDPKPFPPSRRVNKQRIVAAGWYLIVGTEVDGR